MNGFVKITYAGCVRYIAIRHIVSFSSGTRAGDYSTIKTVDGFIHKAEEDVNELIRQIDNAYIED